jgi:hypothetical protein
MNDLIGAQGLAYIKLFYHKSADINTGSRSDNNDVPRLKPLVLAVCAKDKLHTLDKT